MHGQSKFKDGNVLSGSTLRRLRLITIYIPSAVKDCVTTTHRFYRVGLLKNPRLGKCSQNRKMVLHFYGKTKTAITSSKISVDPNFEHRL
jgi:hypothetical protein